MLAESSCSSSSSEELPNLLASSCALLLLLASSLLRAASLIPPKTVTGVPSLPRSWLWVIDPDVDRLTRIVVPLLYVVGVAMSWRPPAAHCSSEAMSSMLRDFGIGSCSVGSAIPVGATGASGWTNGIVTGAGVGC